MNELELFAAAVAVADPVERASLLDRECAGDLAKRARLAGRARLRSSRLGRRRHLRAGAGVVTDLLDDQRYPAADLLAVYLTRWQIENVFQQITEVLHLQRLIGCRPPATVFQASLCLVLFNVLQLCGRTSQPAAPSRRPWRTCRPNRYSRI